MKSLRILTLGIVTIGIVLLLIFFRGQILKIFFGARMSLREQLNKPIDNALCKSLLVERDANSVSGVSEISTSTFNGRAPQGRYIYNLFNATLYSRYPFNDKNLITIEGGEQDGLARYMPALFREGALLGKITNVSRTQSEIETIFDSAWRSSVYIGSSKIKAVLRGGDTPTLEFIPKDAKIQKGDAVVNSSPDFPLNLFIGSISSISDKENELWMSADVNTGYSFDDVKSVFVITNFP